MDELDLIAMSADEVAGVVVKGGSGNRSSSERKEMAGGKKGSAMGDGSFPIGNADELKKAIRALGRATKNSKDAVKAHIKSAASKLGLTASLPDSWSTAKWDIDVDIWKAENAQQIVYGVVLEPNLEDSQGDIITPEEIEKAAHRYLMESRRQDVQHSTQPAPVYPVESYVAPHDMVLHGKLIKKGAWVLGCKVADPDVWTEVIEKKLTGFSIMGSGVRVPIA